MDKTNNAEISPQVLVLALLAFEVGLLPFLFGGASMVGRLVATIIVSLTAVLWFFDKPRLLQEAWWKNPDVLWIPVLLIALLSFTFTPAPWNTGNELWYLISGYLAFVTVRQLSGEHTVRNVAWILVLAAAPVIAWALYTFFTNGNHEARIFGSFKNADGLGAYLVLPIFAAVGLLQQQTKRHWKIALSMFLIVLAGTLLLTSSVPAVGSILLALIIGMIVYRPRMQRRTALLSVGTVVVIIILSVTVRFAAIHQTNNFFALPAEAMRSSLEQRIGFMRSSLHMAADHPWTGVGLGNWSDSFPRYAVSLLERTTLAHGVVFQYLAEGGWIFLVFFLWLLCTIVARILRNGTQVGSPLVRALGLGTVAMAVNGLGDIAWFYPAIVLVFWGMAGLLSFPINGTNEATRNFSWLRGIIAILLLTTLGWGTLRFVADYLTEQAEHAAQQHDVADALGTADLAMQFFPSPVDKTALITMQYVASTKDDRAVTQAWADRALASDRIMAITYVIPARLAQERGDTAKAESLYREGLRLDPHWTPDLSVELSRLLLEQNRNAEAEQIAGTSAEQFGKGIPQGETSLSHLWELAGVAALNQGKRTVALERLEKAVAIDPKNSAASGLLHDAFGK